MILLNSFALFLLNSILITRVFLQPCPEPSSACQNGGVFNEKLCACNCFPSYNGTLCEKISCEMLDPFSCGTFSKSLCSITIISNYCPKLCDKPCNTLKCLNGGKLRNNKCECTSQFEGKSCENIKCLKEDQRCYVILRECFKKELIFVMRLFFFCI